MSLLFAHSNFSQIKSSELSENSA
uniref:Uncharacterized protein n=1 Tax=Rhizophora mucronata TaxID=61149 RepID=A0A2P2QWH1_RHIMU